jgi:hypothetical protein
MLSDNPETTKTILQASLTRAITYSNFWVAVDLLDVNEDLDASLAIEGVTYLYLLLRTRVEYDFEGDFEEVVTSLVIYGANVTGGEMSGFSPLQLCVKEGWDLKVFELLWNSTQAAEYYGSLNNEDLIADMERLLDLAIISNNIGVAEFLVGDPFYKKFLSEAQWLEFAIARNVSVIWTILSRQSRCFTKEELDRQLALQVAARSHMPLGSYEFLVEKAVNTSVQDSNGNTPLHDLSQFHELVSLEKMKLTLKAAADLNICNYPNFTPLALEVRCKNTPATQLLIEAGANPDIPIASHQTALHLACSVGNTDAAQLLLEKGCNLLHRDSCGLTPKTVALNCGYATLAGMIQTAINKRSQISLEDSHDVSSLPPEDHHGKLPLRITSALELPSFVMSMSNSSLKRCNSNMDLGDSEMVAGKKHRVT